ncbi:5876_t:CDS:10, partial [Racocetra fulgida]
MGDIDAKLRAINEKIKKEAQMRQAAERVKSQTTNPQVQAQCEQNIVDAARNIDYLQKELERLQIRQRNSLQYPTQPGQHQAQQISPGGNYSPISPHHSYSYPQPNQLPNYPNAPPQSYGSSIPATRRGGLSNLDLIKSDAPFARQKVTLKLHELEFKLDVERRLKEGSEKMCEAVSLQDPKNKKGIAEVQYLAHAPTRTLKSPETTVVIKIDGATKGKTKASRNDRWNEDFEIHVEKASEIEITLYDKPHEHPQPIGLLWIKISDIAEELRKKRIEAESGPGWVSASNPQFEMQSSPTSAVNNGPPYSIPYSSAQPQEGAGTAVLPDGIEAWFDVEPVGQILLKLNFAKENAGKRPDAGLGRQGAFRKRKGEVHEQNGHKFLQQIFYQIMKCAYCEELFVNEGYQCDDCGISCHAKCAHLVPDFCGMSMKRASDMIEQIRVSEHTRGSLTVAKHDYQPPKSPNTLPPKQQPSYDLPPNNSWNQMPVITSPIPERPHGDQPPVIPMHPPKDKSDVAPTPSSRKVGLDDFNFLAVLEYLHKQGIIYRDLKLDNILLTLDGHIKIADYGLCKENMGYGDTTNTFCGTPEFMAPEILLEQRYGRAVDWWAFGVLIYEMLLGQSPFRGDDEDEIFDAILEDEILYPINMSRDSVSILQKLLTRDPERRLGSGKSDAEEIKRHPFFKGVNWDDMLAKKVPPPFYPTISSPTDTSNFDEEFTREDPVLTPVHSKLTMENQDEFLHFSYV